MQAETVLVNRVGGFMSTAGLPTTKTGTNSALDDPMAFSLRTLNITPASLTTVTDADLTTIDATNVDQFLDVAEWRTLIACIRNFTEYDARVDLDEKKQDQIRKGMQDAENKALRQVQNSYGVSVATPTGGSIYLNFAEVDDTATTPLDFEL